MARVRIEYRPRAGLQEAFHRDRYKVPRRVMFAGTGGGKSLAGAFEVVSWMLENPGCRGAASEPDLPMVRRAMYEHFEKLFGLPMAAWGSHPIVASWNISDRVLRFRNGSTVTFIGLEDPQKTEGPNLDFWWADEIRLVRKWKEAFKAIRRRLRGSAEGNRVGFWATTHSPTKPQVDEFEGPDAVPGCRVYRWSTLDNPILSEDYLEDVVRAHTGYQYDRVILGEWGMPEGLVYQQFDHRKHIRASYEAPAGDETVYGVDWGHSVPASIQGFQWAGESVQGLDEFYGAQRSIGELVAAAKDMVAEYGDGVFWCGHDRPEHIQAFRDAGLDARPNTSKVQDGLDRLNSMLKEGELHISPLQVNLLREIETYAYKPDTEIPEKGDDHAVDAWRYAVMGRGHIRRARAW